MIDVQSGGSTINVYISSTGSECRLDTRKWDREVQTGCISWTFRAFQDKAVVRVGNLTPESCLFSAHKAGKDQLSLPR